MKCPSFLNRPFPYSGRRPCVQFRTNQRKVGTFVYGKRGGLYFLIDSSRHVRVVYSPSLNWTSWLTATQIVFKRDAVIGENVI